MLNVSPGAQLLNPLTFKNVYDKKSIREKYLFIGNLSNFSTHLATKKVRTEIFPAIIGRARY